MAPGEVEGWRDLPGGEPSAGQPASRAPPLPLPPFSAMAAGHVLSVLRAAEAARQSALPPAHPPSHTEKQAGTHHLPSPLHHPSTIPSTSPTLSPTHTLSRARSQLYIAALNVLIGISRSPRLEVRAVTYHGICNEWLDWLREQDAAEARR